MNRLALPLFVTLALAMLAAPAASRGANGSEIRFGPVPAARGYELSGTITSGGGLTGVIVQLARSRGRATESYELRWLGRFRYSASSSLRSARASVRFGGYGSLALAFTPSTVSRGRCRGWNGTLTGALRLTTHERFFGVIRKRSLRARIVALTGRCSAAAYAGASPRASLSVSGRAAGGGTVGLFAFRIARRATVSVEYDRARTGRNLTVADAISLTGGPGLFSYVHGGATIAARSALLSGDARFASRSGRMSGELVASFDDIGRQQVLAHGPLHGGISVCACLPPPPPPAPTPPPPPPPAPAVAPSPVLGPGSDRRLGM